MSSGDTKAVHAPGASSSSAASPAASSFNIADFQAAAKAPDEYVSELTGTLGSELAGQAYENARRYEAITNPKAFLQSRAVKQKLMNDQLQKEIAQRAKQLQAQGYPVSIIRSEVLNFTSQRRADNARLLELEFPTSTAGQAENLATGRIAVVGGAGAGSRRGGKGKGKGKGKK